ncbi:ead/Ea22-like family protein [Klebsiella pneumoniae]|uniref:ead/Ea22-like family protein n=1 Tax=Klebsiella pneumoniae TaxID=573 RepID=UPI0012642303|nr:ead/Ea22-like family protein [Klebsiella pneumoniae]KAB7974379.1 ead/Ea22-like family protein [Klebsiella pneumoniae]KAB7977654.1 ead/Ea22-like family protein [Klebsiella pneumoniae]KAB7992273.1 ead/Ea22-like family protein [Klebsiella pneumoniae]KAB7994446.1 ead/Ea22-like family protein [Klebsiella pneumoniae]MCY3452918.1 ead/Ea22-like family protein [Klebsiella pneumoniae]
MTNITELTAEKLEEIRQRYRPTLAPKCHICGVEMTIQLMSASRITYGCAGATYDETGCHYAEGRSLADDHYAESRITVVDVSDPDVLAMVEALEKAQQERDEFRNRLKLERSILEDADKRIAELEEAEQKLCAANVTLDARAELAERQLAELESRTVKLPAACADDEYFNDGVFQPMRYERDVERALRAAGIKVEAE